jgi:hypothetical protein
MLVLPRHSPTDIGLEEVTMLTPKVTEVNRLSAHRRQLDYVRESVLRGIRYEERTDLKSDRSR